MKRKPFVPSPRCSPREPFPGAKVCLFQEGDTMRRFASCSIPLVKPRLAAVATALLLASCGFNGTDPDEAGRQAADAQTAESSSDPDFARWEERSEEHTSELQSRENLVCRLLLEKKNDTIIEQPV